MGRVEEVVSLPFPIAFIKQGRVMAKKRTGQKAAALRGPKKKPTNNRSSPAVEYEFLYHAHEPKLESLTGLKEALNEKAKEGWRAISFMRGPVTVCVVLERAL